MNAAILPLLAAALAMGLPIFVALGAIVFVALGGFSSMPLTVVAQRMFAGIDNFTLMAIPFFVLAAELMRVGGLADRLIDLARVLVGWLPGGMAVAAVLSCLFFASISGSSPATLAAIGTIMIPALIRAGYETLFVVGLITTAGTLGLVIPPSITLIIFGAVTGTSIGQLFAAGLLPGITIGILLMAYCVIHARSRGMAMGRPPGLREIAAALRRAVWALGLPVVLLGGIYSGVFTPTESAAVACLYGLVVGLAITRGLKPGDLFEVFRSAGLISATLLLITAGASAFSWLLASQAIPTQIASAILSFTENRYAVLALFNVILLLAGCFLDGASAVIILAPLMTPIASSVGVDPVHFGIITLINVEIGMLTPPVGLNLFVACAIARLPLQEVVKAVLPTLGILFLGLLLVTYVPALSLWLPGLLYP